MYKLVKQGSGFNDKIHFYICDTEEDLYNIPSSKNVPYDSIGDKAYVINTSKRYIKNSMGEWKINNSGTGGSTATEEDIQEAVTTYLDNNQSTVQEAVDSYLKENVVENTVTTEDVLILQGGTA